MCSVCAERLARAATALLLGLAACSSDRGSPQEQIRTVVEAIGQAVESGRISDAAQHLHPQYADAWHQNRGAAARTLLGYTRRHSGVHLFTVIRSVDVAPGHDRADAVVYVAMSGMPVDSVESLIALKADLYRFDVQFALHDGQWRVLHCNWKRADPAMF